MYQFRKQKGDGNEGEPDALKKPEMEKKEKNWLELKNSGWLGSYLKNNQTDLPNETRGFQKKFQLEARGHKQW